MFCTTMTHELGHLLGHAHDAAPGSVMAPVFTDYSSVPQLCKEPAGSRRPPPLAARQRVTRSGTPLPMRRASQVMARRAEADAAVRGRGPERAREAGRAVEGDLAGAAVELLQDARAGAGGQRERAAMVERGERDGLLDEEAAARGRRRRPCRRSRGSGARRGRRGRRSRGGSRGGPRSATTWTSCACARPGSSRCARWGGPGAGRAARSGRHGSSRWASTGRTVRTPVSGRRAATGSIRWARTLGRVRAT